jgi:hypothetical protein
MKLRCATCQVGLTDLDLCMNMTKVELEVALASRSHVLVAHASKCGHAIS